MNLENLSALPAPVRKNGLFCCWSGNRAAYSDALEVIFWRII